MADTVLPKIHLKTTKQKDEVVMLPRSLPICFHRLNQWQQSILDHLGLLMLKMDELKTEDSNSVAQEFKKY